MKKVTSIIMFSMIFLIFTIVLIRGLTAFDPPQANPWWPYNGYSSVAPTSHYPDVFSGQTFTFNETAIYNWQEWIDAWSYQWDERYWMWGYEHDVKTVDAYVSRPSGDIQWASSLPDAYLDTDFRDAEWLADATIGTSRAQNLQAKSYWDWMYLRVDFNKPVRPGEPAKVDVYAQRTFPKYGVGLCLRGVEWCLFVYPGANEKLDDYPYPGTVTWWK